MRKIKAWEVSDAFWENASVLIPNPQRDPPPAPIWGCEPEPSKIPSLKFQACQSSTSKPSIRLNSRMLWVTTVMS
jgi:hypothetical protein